MPEPISIANAAGPGPHREVLEALTTPRQDSASPWVRGLVSVVMPAYNCEAVLPESIASVVAQTLQEWELVIVDDASVDHSLLVAQKMASRDVRIRVIHLAKNGGVANARNVGMRAARGQYLAFLDSDDLWDPRKLQIQVEFMKQQGIGFSFTQYQRFGPNGSLSHTRRIPRSLTYRQLLKGNVIGCLTVMVDRARISAFLMPEIGHEDYAAWLTILKRGHVAWGIQQCLARYRVSAASVSGRKGRSAAWTWHIFRRIEKLSFLRSMWCFSSYFARSLFTRMLG